MYNSQINSSEFHAKRNPKVIPAKMFNKDTENKKVGPMNQCMIVIYHFTVEIYTEKKAVQYSNQRIVIKTRMRNKLVKKKQ